MYIVWLVFVWEDWNAATVSIEDMFGSITTKQEQEQQFSLLGGEKPNQGF
jgi:hypothetical protein